MSSTIGLAQDQKVSGFKVEHKLMKKSNKSLDLWQVTTDHKHAKKTKGSLHTISGKCHLSEHLCQLQVSPRYKTFGYFLKKMRNQVYLISKLKNIEFSFH